MKPCFFVTCVLIALCSPCRGDASDPAAAARAPAVEEPTGELRLRDALALTLARNPDFGVVAWEQRVHEARELQAGFKPNPEIEFELENFAGSGEHRALRESETTLSLGQLIELGGKRAARIRSASAGRTLAAWDFEAFRVRLSSDVAAAFIETLILQRHVARASSTADLAAEISEVVQRRVETARALPVEGAKARLAAASARIERDRINAELEAARRRLAAHWGERQPRFQRVVGDLQWLAAAPSEDQLLDRIQSHPDLARWSAEIAKREADLGLERAKRIPDINAKAGLRWLQGPSDGAFVLGASAPWQVFNRNQGGILEAEHELAKARDSQAAAETRVQLALSQARARLSASMAHVQAVRQEILPGARAILDATRDYYNQGRMSYLEVLDAQRGRVDAEAQLDQALADHHLAIIAIERLLGAPLAEAGPDR